MTCVLHQKAMFLNVAFNSWLPERVTLFFLVLTNIQGWNQGAVGDKIVFLLCKGQTLNSCFSFWFLSDSSECLRQILYFLSHFLYLKNGLHCVIFPPLLSELCCFETTLYSLCSNGLLPGSFSRRGFSFPSRTKEWGEDSSSGLTGQQDHSAVVSSPDDFVPQETLATSRDTFDYHGWG